MILVAVIIVGVILIYVMLDEFRNPPFNGQL